MYAHNKLNHTVKHTEVERDIDRNRNQAINNETTLLLTLCFKYHSFYLELSCFFNKLIHMFLHNTKWTVFPHGFLSTFKH